MDLLTYCASFAPDAERGYERGDEGYDMNEAREAYMTRVEADPVRELLSATRLMHGDKHPTLFVEAAVCAA